MIDTLQAELVLDARATLGEGPVWDEAHGRLDWVDILNRRLHHFDPRSGEGDHVDVGSHVGAFARRRKGGYVLALRDGFALLDAAGEVSTLAPVDSDGGRLRMNDGKCDSRGRFWAGTMAYDVAQGAGSLYRLEPGGEVTRVLSDVTISNGIDWSADDRLMYYIDSFAYGVDVFDFDADSGTLSNRRRAFDVANDTGAPLGITVPDGMTMDAEGYLWVAVHGAGEVRRYAPDGRVERVVTVPVLAVTSCAFGGVDLDELYITTAGEHRRSELDGGLFRCRPGVRGRPARTFAG